MQRPRWDIASRSTGADCDVFQEELEPQDDGSHMSEELMIEHVQHISRMLASLAKVITSRTTTRITQPRPSRSAKPILSQGK